MSNRVAIIETTQGTMKAELFEDKAPITTANFIKLAESGFYDGLIFHRVIRGFMIQGGDPKGTGTGGSKDTIKLETHSDLKHTNGSLSMARASDPNSASSQFFICDGAQPHLDGSYAVFGRVTENQDVIQLISAVKTNQQDRPLEDVKMIKITIE